MKSQTDRYMQLYEFPQAVKTLNVCGFENRLCQRLWHLLIAHVKIQKYRSSHGQLFSNLCFVNREEHKL